MTRWPFFLEDLSPARLLALPERLGVAIYFIVRWLFEEEEQSTLSEHCVEASLVSFGLESSCHNTL
jgi:hypothetical protein